MNEDNFNQAEPNGKEPEEETRAILPPLSPTATAFIALIGIFLLYQVGGALLTIAIFGFDIEKADMNAMRLLTAGGQILLMLLPTLVLAHYVYKQKTSFVLRTKKTSFKEAGLFIVGLILLLPVLQNFLAVQNFIIKKIADASPAIKSLTDLLDQLDKLVEKTYGGLLTAHSVLEGFLIITIVAVIPALCEETLFRGLVQKSFELKFKPHLSILITSIFFGLYHFNPYGLIALISLGAYFGFAAYMSESILVPMSLHFLNNLLSVLAYFILGSDELISSAPSKSDLVLPQLLGFFIFAALFFSYVYYLKKNYHKIVTIKKEET